MNSKNGNAHSNSPWQFVTGLVLASFIGLCTAFVLMRFLGEWEAVHQFSIGVTEGVTAWRAWQNRLLSPYILLVVQQFGMEGAWASKILTYVGIVLGVVCSYFTVFAAIGRMRSALAATLVFAGFYLFLQDRALFLWDTLDVLFFTIFSYLIVFERKLRWLIPITLLATSNRESGLFMALYIIISGFDVSQLHRLRIRVSDRVRIATGGAILFVGVIYTKLSRDLLFVQTIGGIEDEQHQFIGNHLQLIRNLRDLFKNNWTSEHILHSILIFFVLAYLAIRYVHMSAHLQNVTLFTLIMFGGTITFGVANEPRIFLSIMPIVFFIFLHEDGAVSEHRVTAGSEE